jgi:TolA-binding protein
MERVASSATTATSEVSFTSSLSRRRDSAARAVNTTFVCHESFSSQSSPSPRSHRKGPCGKLISAAPDNTEARWYPRRQLEARLEDAQREEEEETSILQSLSKDLTTVQKLVENQVAVLLLSASGHGAPPGGSSSSGGAAAAAAVAALTPVDACAALDPMHQLHVTVHLVKIQVLHTALRAAVVGSGSLGSITWRRYSLTRAIDTSV